MHLSQKEIFKKHLAQTTPFPLMLEMERAQGSYIYGKDGKAFLDLISGIGVSNIGHGNEAVKNAIHEQVEKYMHLMVYGEYVQSPQINFAQLLVSKLPPSLNTVYFVNSGAEATDGALKLAKRVTGRSEIIAFKQAYHGSTHAALSLNSEEYYKNEFRPLLSDVRFLTFNDESELNQISHQTACVIVETVRGESGYMTADTGFYNELRLRCNEVGALLIFDEIQCGMGRTGSLFAFEQEKVVPDILLLGKALGGGMPIGAFISNEAHMKLLSNHPILGHITTFGGHPVVCAAGKSALEELLSLLLIDDVEMKSQQFRSKLKHPFIKNITGRGLMIALEFESFEMNKKIIDGCIEDGVITDWFLFATHKMRIAPPLTITDEEIAIACKIIIKNCEKFNSN